MKQTETLVWIIYDISNDKKRSRLAKRCKEAGLYRVQKSVFLGTIERNRLDELVMQAEELIDKETDSVYAFPLCHPDFKKVITLGQAFDQKLVTDALGASGGAAPSGRVSAPHPQTSHGRYLRLRL